MQVRVSEYIGRITYKPGLVYMCVWVAFLGIRDSRAKALEVSWQPSLSNYLTVQPLPGSLPFLNPPVESHFEPLTTDPTRHTAKLRKLSYPTLCRDDDRGGSRHSPPFPLPPDTIDASLQRRARSPAGSPGKLNGRRVGCHLSCELRKGWFDPRRWTNP